MASQATSSNPCTFSNPSPGDVVVIQLRCNWHKFSGIRRQIIRLLLHSIGAKDLKACSINKLGFGAINGMMKEPWFEQGVREHKHVENEIFLIEEFLST